MSKVLTNVMDNDDNEKFKQCSLADKKRKVNAKYDCDWNSIFSLSLYTI